MFSSGKHMFFLQRQNGKNDKMKNDRQRNDEIKMTGNVTMKGKMKTKMPRRGK